MDKQSMVNIGAEARPIVAFQANKEKVNYFK